jgi:hypothetical protein
MDEIMAITQRSSANAGASSPFYVQAWTATPVDVNLITAGPGGTGGQQIGYFCRRISVQTAGTLVLTRPDGAVITLTCYGGEVLDVEASFISNTSTAQGVKVFW